MLGEYRKLNRLVLLEVKNTWPIFETKNVNLSVNG